MTASTIVMTMPEMTVPFKESSGFFTFSPSARCVGTETEENAFAGPRGVPLVGKVS
jgi:hypothetical protein